MTPDGQFFVTAVAIRQSVVWVHDAGGDRQVSLEGFRYDPKSTPRWKEVVRPDFGLLRMDLVYGGGEEHMAVLCAIRSLTTRFARSTVHRSALRNRRPLPL